MSRDWTRQVLESFDQSAQRYDGGATLQRAVAHRIAGHCLRVAIPPGLWVDLGSGTGFLADALTQIHPGQKVLRLDGSKAMLARHPRGEATLVADLNQTLPRWEPRPTLMTSSFTLHWLHQPTRVLKHWFTRLACPGWMILSVPVNGSFLQWKQAAEHTGLPCTALPLPDREALLGAIPRDAVWRCSTLRFTQQADHPLELLRSMVRIGAGTSPAARMSPSAWRTLFQAWPREHSSGRALLTWHCLLMILRR